MVCSAPLPWLDRHHSWRVSLDAYRAVHASVQRMLRWRRLHPCSVGIEIDDVLHETLFDLLTSRSPYVHAAAMPDPKYLEVTAHRALLVLARRRRIVVAFSDLGTNEDESAGVAPTWRRASTAGFEEPVCAATIDVVEERESRLRIHRWRRTLDAEHRRVLDLLVGGNSLSSVAARLHVSRSRVKRMRLRLSVLATRDLGLGIDGRGLAPHARN